MNKRIMVGSKVLATYANTRSKKSLFLEEKFSETALRIPLVYIHESWDSNLARARARRCPLIWPANEKHTDNTCSLQTSCAMSDKRVPNSARIMHRCWLHRNRLFLITNVIKYKREQRKNGAKETFSST